MSNEQLLKRFDEWLKEDSSAAALVMRQWLVPVEGRDAVIFPPTYPIEQNKPGYNIDRFEQDRSSVCQIDSVGSQANRIEPIFKREPYNKPPNWGRNYTRRSKFIVMRGTLCRWPRSLRLRSYSVHGTHGLLRPNCQG